MIVVTSGAIHVFQAESELSKASTNWLQKQTIEIRIQEIYSCLANLSPLFARVPAFACAKVIDQI